MKIKVSDVGMVLGGGKLRSLKISTAKQRWAVYQFKFGKTVEEIARMYDLEPLEVEQIIREYVNANSPSVVR